MAVSNRDRKHPKPSKRRRAVSARRMTTVERARVVRALDRHTHVGEALANWDREHPAKAD